MHILIADDSEIFRERLISIITDLGGVETITEAGDVPAALDAIRRVDPDVILLDIEMPGGDSFQVLEEVKSNGSPISVIVLTAFPFPQYHRQFLAAGADYFFDKAMNFDQAIEALGEIQDRRTNLGAFHTGAPKERI
ncbi:MAG: response regulator transcription factor [Anaerolineae bacterium]|nr:response regulator transcription factor [Anaerolineae bacterium]